LPVLAICRGIQVLNVACGGTLLQDIPTQVMSALTHRLPVPVHQPIELAHRVRLKRNTMLGRILADRISAADDIDVNSRHHQAVKDVATGFVVSATAPDGVIEAVEDPDGPFCIGIQWHPESFWRTGEFAPLFTTFVDRSRRAT
jgi:putative glutamine amidotransferase